MSRAVLLLALALGLTPMPTARALTVVKAPAAQLAARADLVVLGRARRFAGFHEGTRIHTQVSVEVLEVWRDSAHRRAQRSLDIKLPGGVVHDNAQAILGMPALPADAPLVFFLAWPRSGTGEWETVGLGQGIWELAAGAEAGPEAWARAWVHPLGASAAGGERMTAAALRALLGADGRGG